MKKFLFLAATAMMFAACSNEEITSPNTGETAFADKAVGFDVYIPGATNTRAGLEGTMTTARLQRSEANGGGFGVYAFLTEDAEADAGAGANATAYTPTAGQDPNFMANEKILWNETNLGWYYSPLKYWPNETDHDSQTTPATMEGTTPVHLDRLTFFAYAPYVSAGAAPTGITAITDNTGQLSSTDVTDPTIAWTASETPTTDFNPNQGVDLLWGVAPAGGLSYTAVNGTTVTVDEGKPLIDMIKPDVNTSMKFLFNHSLARFGFTVVAAVDQVSAGGELDPNTKITINSLKITGPFGTGGELNLNNGENANIANWTKMTGGAADEGISSSTANLTADKNVTISTYIADNLKYAGAHTFGSYSAQNVVGVTTAKQDLLDPSTKWFNKLAAAPVYNPGKKYFTDAAGTTEAHASYTVQTSDNIYEESAGVYSQASGTINTPNYPADQTATAYYSLEDDETFAASTADPGVAGVKYYTKSAGVYTYVASPTWPNSEVYYTVKATKLNLSDIDFEYSGDIYEAERNYVYVVPTNNVSKNAAAAANVVALRTITVQIEYYITTEDSKINGGRTQTKNVITKEVVLPSLQNGKTYNLNMVLGLTSVKIEAEVDDWKVVNGQVDLPQNTAE